ncbi:hypothetical protein OKW40_002534 [Paraburkholderia sp. RAU6.4a]|uniref:hypothetical protein n=1 Tax=Paraburkholderia sp. RAU6.4a TaxID=2991067 RepID=UPI003D23173A
MADADWTGYVGMATGIFGAVMGFIGYRRSNQIKALDLRLDLRKALGDAHNSLSTLRAMMNTAAQSRRAILAAKGLGGSGAMAAWNRMADVDLADIDTIAASLRSEDADFSALPAEHLEFEIVFAHKIKNRLSTLIDKYRDELAADAAAREQIAQAQAMLVASRQKQ